MKTIMITGCSSGFGLEAARLFLDRGWSVVATMRNPQEGLLPASERLRILPLDVTDRESIAQAVETAGPIDALVNNAGIGWANPLEATPEQTVRHIFETNTFGTMETIRAVLPGFRERGEGTIVNVSSSVTLRPLHMLSVYTASKAAVNAFTECLALELEPFGIRTRLVLPGQSLETQFGTNARAIMNELGAVPGPYQEMMDRTFAAHLADTETEKTHPDDVTRAIWRAVTDPDCPMRLPAGADAEALSA